MNRSFLSLAAAALLLVACRQSKAPVYKGEGERVAEGPAREVITAPGGGAIGFLADPFLAKEKGVAASDMTYVGKATVVGAEGGAPLVLGEGVTTLPGAFFFSPDGKSVGALTRWSFPLQKGKLVVAPVGGQARVVAEEVSYFGFSRKGNLVGYVADRKLLVEPVDGSRDGAQLADQVGTFEFSPDGERVAIRRRALGGGQLLLADVGGKSKRVLGESVTDYSFSPDGKRIAFTAREDGGSALFLAELDGDAKPRKVGKNVPQFRFSPDGKSLAFRGNTSPKKQFGELLLLADGASKAAVIGSNVTEFAFSPDGARIAWLDEYSAQSRGGTLKWADVKEEPESKKVASNVPSFIWSHDGEMLAYIGRIATPAFSIDLFLARLDEESKPVKVGRGVFGYSFSKDDEYVYFRTECTRNARACDLHAVAVDNPEAPARLLANGIFTYEPDPNDESVLMITYARTDADALDLAVVPTDASVGPRVLDRMVIPGTKFVGGESDRIAYAVLEQKRLGVYVADPAAKPRATEPQAGP